MEQLLDDLAMTRSPMNRDIRSEQVACSRHVVNTMPGTAWIRSDARFSSAVDDTMGSLCRHLRNAWREESRERPCACSKVAICFSGRIAPHSPRSSSFLRNEEGANNRDFKLAAGRALTVQSPRDLFGVANILL